MHYFMGFSYLTIDINRRQDFGYNERMKYWLLGVFVLIIAVVLVIGGRKVAAPEGEGGAEEQTNTSTTSPAQVPSDVAAAITAKANLIQVTNPQPGASVTSPITVSGQARGTWFFEASFPLMVVDWDGKIIGNGYATADGEWMTEEFVPFSGTISYTKEPGSYSDAGAIIFRKDNPSGLPEHDDALEIPVVLE